MKSMKKLQVAVAVTALFAATGSMAASISQSGLTVAREVIVANTNVAQSLKAPSASYNFDNGPTANAQSSQDFNVTLKLGGDGTPEWGGNTATYKTIAAVRRNNGNTVVPVVAAGHVEANANTVFIRLLGVDDVDAQTKRFRFRLENQSAASVSLGDLQLSFNSVNPGNGAVAPYILTTNATTFDVTGGANTALTTAPLTAEFNNLVKLAASANATNATTGTAAGETGYFDGNGAAADNCGEGLRRITLVARNYIGSGVGVEGESAGANLASITNNGYIVFGTALGVKVDIGAARNRATDPTANNVSLTIPAGSGVAADVMALGRVRLSNIAGFNAWDTDTTGNYYAFAPTSGTRTENEFTVTTATDGDVDVNDAASGAITLAITSSNGFATGTTFALSNTPSCTATAGAVVTTAFGQATAANATVANLAFTLAELDSMVAATPADTLTAPTIGTYAAYFGTAPVSGNNGFYICMKTPGGAVQIPQSSFTAVAKLLKNHALEQNNFSCPAPLAGLGGGVKIDVRNFFPYQSDSQEWISVLRVINNSESTTADLTGQYIRADGKYGKWGSLGNLPARGAVYFTSKEIDTLLNQNTTTAGAAITDNTGAGGTVGAAGKLAPNTRVRISSNAASTLRVQNYMFNTSTLQLVEVSASQGADFVNVESSARDHIDQDAQTGIKK